MTVVPEALQDLAPLAAQVDPHLFVLTKPWVSGGTAGDAITQAVRELCRQVAALRDAVGPQEGVLRMAKWRP